MGVAYKNTVGSRRAAWRIITSIEQKEKSKGNTDQAQFAREYCVKVETELDSICSQILELLNGNLLEKASTDESKVFYHKMKADYYRYIAEFKTEDAKTAAAENARNAFEDAIAELDNVAEDSYKDSTLIMQLLRDNLT